MAVVISHPFLYGISQSFIDQDTLHINKTAYQRIHFLTPRLWAVLQSLIAVDFSHPAFLVVRQVS